MRRALVVALLLIAACGDSGTTTTAEPPATAPTTTTTSTTSPTVTTAPAATTSSTAQTSSTTTSTTTTTTTVPADPVQQIEVTVSNGDVLGGVNRAEVELGSEVRLVVFADVADEVHVHGYDLFAEVDPDYAAELEFTADIPGIFEVELESAHTLIVELEVS